MLPSKDSECDINNLISITTENNMTDLLSEYFLPDITVLIYSSLIIKSSTCSIGGIVMTLNNSGILTINMSIIPGVIEVSRIDTFNFMITTLRGSMIKLNSFMYQSNVLPASRTSSLANEIHTRYYYSGEINIS